MSEIVANIATRLTGRAGRQRSASARPVFPVVTLALALLTLAAGTSASLQFDRPLVLGGEIWRIIAGHFVHWSPGHLLWSLLAFVVLGVCCERIDRLRTVITIIVSSILIPLLVNTSTYRGLSGIDSALFGLLAMLMPREQRKLVLVFLVAFVLKIALEFATGHTFFANAEADGFVPVPLAHLVGIVIGLLVGLLGRSSAATIARR